MPGNEAAKCEHIPGTVDTLGEIKKFLLTFHECVVLSLSLYNMLIKLLFS